MTCTKRPQNRTYTQGTKITFHLSCQKKTLQVLKKLKQKTYLPFMQLQKAMLSLRGQFHLQPSDAGIADLNQYFLLGIKFTRTPASGDFFFLSNQQMFC